MTKEEARKKLLQATTFNNTEMASFLDALESLNLLQFDEPKTTEQEAAAKLREHTAEIEYRPLMQTVFQGGSEVGISGRLTKNSADILIAFLKASGFRLVKIR